VDVAADRLTLWKMQHPVRGLLHGAAAIASAVGAVLLWSRGTGDPLRQLALLAFAASLIALYTVSTLYHAVPWREVWKRRMQRLDHSMIYVLIAGTYTPIGFVVLHGWLRWATLATVWGIALVGIAQKVVRPATGPWLSITMQTVQGWFGLLLVLPLSRLLPWPALLLCLLGGVLYSVGLAFFLTRRPLLWPRVFSNHELFHLFVVAGSIAHYLMILHYIAPFARA
jgi:hemolysin III